MGRFRPVAALFNFQTLSHLKPSLSKPLIGYILSALFAGTAVYLLFAYLPYASGYGAARIDILQFAKWVWDAGEDWQHCYLVPLAIAVLLYFDRRRLATVPLNGSWLGLGILLFGLFVYWIGFLADNVYLGYASFQLVMGGLIFWVLGWQWMVALAFPWAMLVFLYPLPFMDNLVAFPLRLVMSEASVHVLNLIGVPTIKAGTAILSASDPVSGAPTGQRFMVDVADPCSGIRSLFALMMVSAIYAHLTQKGFWRQLVLFLFSMPLAVLGNLARILMLTLGTIAMGANIAIGTSEDPSFFHELAGYIVFAVALGGMIGVGALLQKDWPAFFRKLRPHATSAPAGATQPAAASSSPSKPPFRDEY